MEWYRNDKAAVAEAMRRGERPDLATTMASGPLDELVALHQALGIFAIVDELEVQRTRAGIDDELLLRTLATLPFVEHVSLSGASEMLFREPAVLLHLGWAPATNPAGQQWTASTSRWTARGVAALSSGYAARRATTCRGVCLAARARSRGQSALSATVRARQSLCYRWQRIGQRFPFGGPGVCLSHASHHRGLATVEWACLGERPRSGGDALAD